MIKSKLPNNVLGKVWKLSDVDKDGLLDADEFALAMHLINIKLDGEIKYHYTTRGPNITFTTLTGHDLPTELPAHLVPPSKRGF